jgi:hypothetical protein
MRSGALPIHALIRAFAFLAILPLWAMGAPSSPLLPVHAAALAPDVRLILQTQGGLAAYEALTETVSLDEVRPLFSDVAIDGPDYLEGSYTLAGRTDVVGLAIGAGGWVVAWQPRSQASQDLYDCPLFDTDHPGIMTNRPEEAVIEVAAALGISGTTASFYDFRNPPATRLSLEWLFFLNNGSQESALNLPLANTYLERGYAFCTTLTNSKLWLNQELIDQEGSPSQVYFHDGPLSAAQLRAGQTNALKIEARAFFGGGLLGGVSMVYSGTAPIAASGGYSRTLPLAYPPFLGQPLTIHQAFLPLASR